MARWHLALAMAGAAMLSGCVERVYPDGREPLRQPETREEALYLACFRQDPSFRNPVCREARAAVLADPYPGSTGR